MKFLKVTLLFFSTLLACCFISCEEEGLNQNFTVEQETFELANNVETDKSSMLLPDILLDQLAQGICCSELNDGGTITPFGKRLVHIILEDMTYDTYCANGDSLIYKFYYKTNSVCGPNYIIRHSNERTPTFCLPAGWNYELIVCPSIPNYNCELKSYCNIAPGSCPCSFVAPIHIKKCFNKYEDILPPRKGFGG